MSPSGFTWRESIQDMSAVTVIEFIIPNSAPYSAPTSVHVLIYRNAFRSCYCFVPVVGVGGERRCSSTIVWFRLLWSVWLLHIQCEDDMLIHRGVFHLHFLHVHWEFILLLSFFFQASWHIYPPCSPLPSEPTVYSPVQVEISHWESQLSARWQAFSWERQNSTADAWKGSGASCLALNCRCQLCDVELFA